MFFLRNTPAAETILPFEFEIDGTPVVIAPRRHAKARRMVLRAARDGKGFVLTLPKRHSQRAMQDFLRSSKEWMRGQMERQETGGPFGAGSNVLLRGENYVLVPTGKLRGTVMVDEECKRIATPGSESHLKRRITDWLKAQALADLRAASGRYASEMEASFTRISVRDQKSRWGSCTTDGALSFSWRLVMAPPYVLDYVAAHEVAHLREMNHGPRFWRLVLSHCKHTRQAKTWLKQHGNSLHRAL